ncbi:MAG TPA: thioredoxin domain-containing protein, partial [Cyanophyceae cyanobacterium]
NNQEAKTGNWLGRIPPVTDTKMIVAWNSLMISGLARSYSVFGHPEYLQLAATAASFILDNQWLEGRFHRLNYDGEPSILAQSEDYALFIKALLDLHQASLSALGSKESGELQHITKDWLEKALNVQEEFDEFLWSVELAGYYNAASDSSSDLLVRERSYSDNATPSANGVAIANLVRLALLTEDLQYLDRAEKALQSFSSAMNQSPQLCPSLFTALDWYHACTLVRSSAVHLTSLMTQFLPTTVYQLEANLPQGAVGLVCKGLSCLEPSNTFEQLLEQVQRSQTRS